MSSSNRFGRYDATTSTSYIVRTNLRRLRTMRGLTQHEAVSRLAPPCLSVSALGKIENGDRSVSIEEVVQLSLAYQVPIQVIVCPWGPLETHAAPVLSGGSRETSTTDVQQWLLKGDYPPLPSILSPVGSSLEGTASAAVFRHPENLAALADSPTPETLRSLLQEAVQDITAPIINAIDAFVNDLEEWLGFDPFPLFKDFEETPEALWPPEFRRRLNSAPHNADTEELERLWRAHRSICSQVSDIVTRLDPSATTSAFPAEEIAYLQQQARRLDPWDRIYIALRTGVLR